MRFPSMLASRCFLPVVFLVLFSSVGSAQFKTPVRNALQKCFGPECQQSAGFVVGQVDPSDGALIVSVGPFVDLAPSMAPSLPVVGEVSIVNSADVSMLRVGNRMAFRKSLLAAGRNARDSGQITGLEFFLLSAASRNPATLEKMQAAVHEAAIEEGLATTQAIDWDSLIEFIEKLIPIIIKLIELFGQVRMDAVPQYV